MVAVRCFAVSFSRGVEIQIVRVFFVCTLTMTLHPHRLPLEDIAFIHDDAA
jgi:hypothetical protein